MIDQIKQIEDEFAFYGFICSPLSRKKIASLLLRGFDHNQIYGFGCDAYASEVAA
jgi:hypothetical protein